MTISFSRYVDVNSGVAAGTTIPTKELIGRIFTPNLLLPTQSFLEFTSAAAVGDYFGFSSEEYLRSADYFSFVSKVALSPQKISFARWTAANQAPMIFGAQLTETLTQLQLITSGEISLTLGSNTVMLTGLNFSSAGSLAAIATILQTAIQAVSDGTQWTAATVSYSSTSGGFNFVGGNSTSPDKVVVAPGTSNDISAAIGWLPQSVNGSIGAIWSNGNGVETITQVLTNSAAESDNFGSFLFTNSSNLNLSEITQAAAWNLLQNISFMYLAPVPAGQESTYYAALLPTAGGTGITEASPAGSVNQFPEQLPMAILAAINYSAEQKAVQNFMFQQGPNLTASVTSDTQANSLDAFLVNYYGVSQTAGQQLSFYQRGVLIGPTTSPGDMNTYVNEIWLRSEMISALGNLLLNVSEISANYQGRGQVLTVLQSVINQALTNGVISVGTKLSTAQQAVITNLTGDPNAWFNVQNVGYWVGCVINKQVINNQTTYTLVYTLVYKKDDVIRKISGTHVLI